MRTELVKYNSVEALAMRMTRNLCLDKIKLKKTVPLNGIERNETEEESLNKEKQTEINLAYERAKDAINKLDEPQKNTLIWLRTVFNIASLH